MISRCCRGFARVDLLTSLVATLLLAGILCAQVATTRESANRSGCANQLRAIAKALSLYSQNDSGGAFPRGLYKPDVNAPAPPKPVWGTGAEVEDMFADAKAPVNDVSTELFLLLRMGPGTLVSKDLICPGSTVATPDDFGGNGRQAIDRSNFAAGRKGAAARVYKYCSYSIQNAYPPSDVKKFRWDDTIAFGAQVPIAADINPGDRTPSNAAAPGPGSENGPAASESDLAKANSINHGRKGQNVLYADLHVEWQTTPLSGYKRDNIYTNRQNVVAGAPLEPTDSVLLPAVDDPIEDAAATTKGSAGKVSP